MFDVERHIRLRRLGQPTVLTTVAGTLTDEPLGRRVDHGCLAAGKRLRAFACRMLMKSIASIVSRYSACSIGDNVPSLDFRA